MEEAPVEIPITGEIDLHTFHPRDIAGVVADYLDACHERGLLSVRLIHGRGTGVQRAVVRRLLSARPDVQSFVDASPGEGGWGATCVRLAPLDSKSASSAERGEKCDGTASDAHHRGRHPPE
jgi:DNA-nicking Smr family endonuclease